MRRPCEICSALQPDGASPEPSARYLLIETRVVAVCSIHSKTITGAKVKTLDALSALFTEGAGNRSLLPRRAPVNRRVFPPRPEGRRRGDGRRNLDSSLHQDG